MYMKKVPSKHTSSSNRHKTQPSRNHIGIKRNFYRYRHIPLVMPRRFHIRREHSEFWVMTYLLYSWEKKASCVYYFFLYHSWYSSKLNQNLQVIYIPFMYPNTIFDLGKIISSNTKIILSYWGLLKRLYFVRYVLETNPLLRVCIRKRSTSSLHISLIKRDLY